MSQVHFDYQTRHSIYEYEYNQDDDIDVDLIEVEPMEPIDDSSNSISDYDDGSGVAAVNKTRSEISLLAELSPIQKKQIHEEQLTIFNQIQHEESDYDELDSSISYGTNSNSTQSSVVSFISQYTDDVSDYKPTSRRQSVSFSKFMSLGLKGKLNRSRVSRHIRMLSELKIPAPEANEPILFESKVLKWSSSLSKKPSNNYLVLTKKCLCSFKNAEKAAKVFDGLPLSPRSNHFSGIYDDNFSSSLSSSDVITKNLPPENVIFSLATVYAISEQLTTESHIRVDYISGSKNHDYVSIISEGSFEQHQWFENLRTVIHSTSPVGPYLTLSQRERLMNKLRSLDDLADEDENNFVAFRALLNSIIDQDFEKNPNIPIFFVLGRNNVYFIPFNLIGNDLLSGGDDDNYDQKQHLQPLYYPLLFEHVKPKEIELRKFQYPLLCLTKIHSDENNDDLQLTFKNSIGSMKKSLTITSLVTENIITDIRTAIDSITFWWPSPGYELDAPTCMQATIIPPERESDKTSHAIGFDRMLEAQCHTYRVNRLRISFNIEFVLGESIVFGLGVDHLPFRFILLPPNSIASQSDKQDYTYSNQELMAIFNSLKYHPLLHEIILRNTNLFELQVQPGSRGHKGTNMLATVLYDLLLSNPRLKKLDLTSCGITSETVSAIGEAFMTGQSCLERLLLGNNSITREGIQALASGITGHKSAIKELDISSCKLNHDSIESILHALDTNDPSKLEVLDISNNRCNLESNILAELLSKTISLRTINLHNCVKLFVRTGPVISTEVLGNTQLTTLNVGGISFNKPELLEALYIYLQSPSFAKLQYLNVAGCELDGEMLAIILSYVTTSPNHKKIRVWAGGNQIMKTSQGHKEFCNAIRNNWTPTWLSLKETRFGPHIEMIVDIIQAFCENSVIKYLDLSYPKFRLRGDPHFSPQSIRTANKACEAIGNLFKENQSIKELELMGDTDRRFGPSLGPSLFELEENYTLEKLNIKGNSISDHGAKALSEALKSNTKLRILNCDENEIGIIGYSAIHNVFTKGLNTVVQQFTYPIQDIENFNEALDAKLAILTRENLFSPKISQKVAFEKQKNNLRQVVDEIMKSVEDIGSFEDNNYYNDDEYKSSSTTS